MIISLSKEKAFCFKLYAFSFFLTYSMLKTIAIACLSLVLIKSNGQNVKVRTIKKTDFTKFETFTVIRGDFTIPKDERRISDEKFYEMLKTFIRQELELKGYKFIEDSTADFAVDYVAGAFSVTESENLGPLGGTPALDPAQQDQSRYWSNSYREGLLVLNIYNGKKENTLWTSESTVDLSTVNSERAVAAVVAKSFKKFPAKHSKKKKK